MNSSLNYRQILNFSNYTVSGSSTIDEASEPAVELNTESDGDMDFEDEGSMPSSEEQGETGTDEHKLSLDNKQDEAVADEQNDTVFIKPEIAAVFERDMSIDKELETSVENKQDEVVTDEQDEFIERNGMKTSETPRYMKENEPGY